MAKATTLAKDLQTFASREICAEQAQRHGVDRVFFFIKRDYELANALKSGDLTRITREIAEIRLEVGEIGRHWQNKDESCYSAGWQEFDNFVRTK